MSGVSRRYVLSGLMGGALAGSALSGAGVGPARSAEPTLRERAEAKGLLYGCAIKSSQIRDDQPFMQMVTSECDIVVHEWELKRNPVQQEPGKLNFYLPDMVAAYARRNGKKLRGHTLVWYYDTPRWIVDALKVKADPELLTGYIDGVCGHYRGRIHSWDVVNEGVEPNEGHKDGLRVGSPWFQAFGADYLDIAFRTARAADPDALLFYSDYSVEMASDINEKRRTAVLKVLERLKSRNVPIDALGIQGHLKPFVDRFDERRFARFVEEVQSMGLKMMFTELYVADHHGPEDIARRDAQVASVTRAVLDVALASPVMLGVMTWGLSDRYSWLSSYPEYRWADGQLSRGLPLDAELQKKPMYYAIAQAFDARK